MQVYNHQIPFKKLKQFHTVLCNAGGFYLANPTYLKDTVLVSYDHGDYEAFFKEWRVLTEDIREVRKDQWWRKMLRRVLRRPV